MPGRKQFRLGLQLVFQVPADGLLSAAMRPDVVLHDGVTTPRKISFHSACRRLLHDFDNRVLHFLGHSFQLGRVEQRQQSGWLQSGQNGFAALLVNGDPAWQCGGDAHILVENLLRLLRLTDLEDQTFTGELHALLRHGLLEVVNLHNAKIIGLNGGLQGSRSLAYRFVRR